MTNFEQSLARFIVPKTVNHEDGSKTFKAFGAKSAGTKIVNEGEGLPVNTQEECETALARCFDFAEKLKLNFSGVYFAFLKEAGEDQPIALADMRKATQYAVEHGMDVWLSKRGKLTVGHNQTGKKLRRTKAPREVSKTENAAIAAFLKD